MRFVSMTLVSRMWKFYNENQVLVAPTGSLSWIDGEGGAVPSNAVIGGQANDGETLYIGRVVHNGTVTVGKIHPSHGVCYFPYGKTKS